MAHGHRRDTGVLGKVLARVRDRVLNRLRVRHADLPAVAVVPVPSSLSLAALESFPQLGVLWMGPTQQALGPAVRYSEKRKPLRVLLVNLPAEDQLEFDEIVSMKIRRVAILVSTMTLNVVKS